MNTQRILMETSKGFGAYSAPKGAVRDIGKAGVPLLGARFTLREHASKAVAFQVAFTAWGLSQPCPGVEGCDGTMPPPELPVTFFSKASGGSHSPELVLQSFIVLCYTKCSFSIPLPSDLILENKINCHLS